LSQSSEQPPGKGLAPRRYPENPDGNGVWPGEVLHGDYQLMRPDRWICPLISLILFRWVRFSTDKGSMQHLPV
jgi:hypothetical protein